jgi:hypothetical protein
MQDEDPRFEIQPESVILVESRGLLTRYVTRVNSTNVLDEGLRIGERAMTRDSGIEIGTQRT